jgi:hypothetical protein
MAGLLHGRKEGKAMRMPRGYVLGFVLVFGITLGAPIALSGVDAPAAAAALTLFVDDAAAQIDVDAEECGIAMLCTTSESEGGSECNGHGGLAILHDRITTTATSDTSQSLSDVQTGDFHNDVSIIVEDTDETVVINMAGNPGSTGVHMMNVGGAPQPVNTGGITSSADASGEGGDGGNSRSNADLAADIADSALILDIVNLP